MVTVYLLASLQAIDATRGSDHNPGTQQHPIRLDPRIRAPETGRNWFFQGNDASTVRMTLLESPYFPLDWGEWEYF
jgi:hypothetical protein